MRLQRKAQDQRAKVLHQLASLRPDTPILLYAEWDWQIEGSWRTTAQVGMDIVRMFQSHRKDLIWTLQIQQRKAA